MIATPSHAPFMEDLAVSLRSDLADLKSALDRLGSTLDTTLAEASARIEAAEAAAAEAKAQAASVVSIDEAIATEFTGLDPIEALAKSSAITAAAQAAAMRAMVSAKAPPVVSSVALVSPVVTPPVSEPSSPISLIRVAKAAPAVEPPPAPADASVKSVVEIGAEISATHARLERGDRAIAEASEHARTLAWFAAKAVARGDTDDAAALIAKTETAIGAAVAEVVSAGRDPSTVKGNLEHFLKQSLEEAEEEREAAAHATVAAHTTAAAQAAKDAPEVSQPEANRPAPRRRNVPVPPHVEKAWSILAPGGRYTDAKATGTAPSMVAKLTMVAKYLGPQRASAMTWAEARAFQDDAEATIPKRGQPGYVPGGQGAPTLPSDADEDEGDSDSDSRSYPPFPSLDEMLSRIDD